MIVCHERVIDKACYLEADEVRIVMFMDYFSNGRHTLLQGYILFKPAVRCMYFIFVQLEDSQLSYICGATRYTLA